MNSFNTALLNIRRSPYQSLAALLMLTLTFFVGYTFSLFVIGSEMTLRYFETRPQVIAFFQLNTGVDTINKIAQEMQGKTYVKEIKLVSQEDALKIYQEENKDDPLLLELVTSQILPASIEVSAGNIQDLAQVKADLTHYSEVEEVVFQQDIIDSLSKWTSTIRLIGLGSVTILATTSFLIMIIVIGLKVVTKRTSINIMRIIGATRWFVKSPFVFEGVIYGLVSSMIGWLIMFTGLLYISPWLESFLGSIKLFPIPPALFALQLSAGSLIGMILGAMAGAVAVGRVIRK